MRINDLDRVIVDVPSKEGPSCFTTVITTSSQTTNSGRELLHFNSLTVTIPPVSHVSRSV